MKRTLIFLCLTAALFSACKKETTTAVENDYISFKVNGVLKTGNNCQGVYFKSKLIDFSRIDILSNNNNEQIFLDVTNPVVGKPVELMSAGSYYVKVGTDTIRYTSLAVDKITITSLTTDRVTGTFQFTGTNYFVQNLDTKTITEGSFGCKVIVQ